MDDLVINHKLPAPIVDDQRPDTTPPICKSTINLPIQAALIHHGKTLLDIAALRHADQAAILTHIQDAILLEDGA